LLTLHCTLFQDWREFCDSFKDLDEFSFASLVRLDSTQDYSEENSIIVTKVQFYAIELSRNREGHNLQAYAEDEEAGEGADGRGDCRGSEPERARERAQDDHLRQPQDAAMTADEETTAHINTDIYCIFPCQACMYSLINGLL
jgi:hypothetical protein